jgi:tetratricopeptide (TPR) repeat protein
MREFELNARMSAESWARIEVLFDEAMTQPTAQRGAWLEQRLGTDEWLRRHVNRLIEQAGAPDGASEQPQPVAALGEAPTQGPASDTQIGRWRLGSLIACDRTSEVYRAECIDDMHVPQAAFRLIRHGAVESIERFEEQGRVLARLDHPGIARMIEVGTTSDGRPFIVVEWIDGIPLMRWCRERDASLSQRLNLFLQVCEAAAYAHRNLLVHRDIEPGKVLVTAQGEARLMDLGMAALLRNDGMDERRAQAPMTLAYASPEQLALEPVTPASDVYSLGLILFELLTGERPWHRSRSSLPLMRERQLRAAPPSPSSIAQARVDAPIEARFMRGDLDALVALALQREPARRYRSAAEFADDLRRHLQGRPLFARPDTLAYEIRHLVSRHRVAATFIGIAILSLILATAGALRRASEARLAAETSVRDAARSAVARDFFVDVLRAPDLPTDRGEPRVPTTNRELLDLAVPKIDQRFHDDPAMQVELLGVTASIYSELGDQKRYHELRAQSLAQLRRLHRDTHPAVIQGLLDEAHHASEQNDDARAAGLLAELDSLIRKAGLDNTTTRARWWLIRSGIQENGTWADPAALGKALEMYERLSPGDAGFVESLTALGWRDLPINPTKAEQHFLRAIAVAQKSPGRGEHSSLQSMWAGLAQSREDQGRYDLAIEARERGAAMIETLFGSNDGRTRLAMALYAWALHRDGQRVPALAKFETLIPIAPASGNASPTDEDARDLFAERVAAEGRPLEAIPLLETALTNNHDDLRGRYEQRRRLLILGGRL